jgi:hypothetical protein
MIRWEQGAGTLMTSKSARPTQGLKAVGKSGVAIHRMRKLFAHRYSEERFHQNVVTIIPHNPIHLPAIWCFCSSPKYNEAVRKIDQALKVTNATLVKVPFDLQHWQKVAAQNYPHGLEEPESDDPTQWIFHGNPKSSTAVLQVAVARLLGYRWPAELDDTMRLSKYSLNMITRCEELLPIADKDGIVCISPVRGEASAADRLLNFLAKAYGNNWNADELGKMLKEVGFENKTLERWLRDGFFSQHCELFHQRPFIWQIWDGLHDGFSVLVNYHKLNRKTLETLIYNYLGDWIIRQKDDIALSVDGAMERLSAAEALKNSLELILRGEAPYDIFVRWKPIEQQPIGWEPDLNDGVRVNIRPFLDITDVKTKGAGVLRIKPKINWGKDRGKETNRSINSYPWFWGWDGTVDFTGGSKFTGERFNDCHYTLNFKGLARQRPGE